MCSSLTTKGNGTKKQKRHKSKKSLRLIKKIRDHEYNPRKENWLDVLEKTDFEPEESTTNSYQSYRFTDLDINSVTIENYAQKLVPSLVEQVEMFVPPSVASKPLTYGVTLNSFVAMRQVRPTSFWACPWRTKSELLLAT